MEAARETIHRLVDNISNDHLSIVRHILVGFIPEDNPYPDEVAVIARSEKSIAEFGTVDFDDIDWE